MKIQLDFEGTHGRLAEVPALPRIGDFVTRIFDTVERTHGVVYEVEWQMHFDGDDPATCELPIVRVKRVKPK